MCDMAQINKNSWWCVVDFDTTIMPHSITVRMGEKGSVKGNDYVVRDVRLNDNVAGDVWAKFNEIQNTTPPDTLDELLHMMD